ncbi:hypothetical protein [Nonomuraea sediminis]|uniref:hypothetical protein n=1 Tax=Nonomuraea sediminis TaxID=2835864 RepID=UPI001BDCD256|nr:hypothetical protein [Nonomuraea sediminis]
MSVQTTVPWTGAATVLLGTGLCWAAAAITNPAWTRSGSPPVGLALTFDILAIPSWRGPCWCGCSWPARSRRGLREAVRSCSRAPWPGMARVSAHCGGRGTAL